MPRSTSSCTIARFPTPRTEPWSASTSTRSTRWRSLDLSKEPMVLSVPDMGNRFWVMQIIDAWNNVPHAPGSRTVGSKGGHFAIVGPTWKGTLPEGVTELRVPTNLALIGGRTYTGGPDDYAAVHALQDQYTLVPLSSWGKPYTPPATVPLKEGVDAKTPVPKQVLALSPEDVLQPSQSPAGDEPARTGGSEDDGAPGDARHRTGRDVPHGRVHARRAQGDRGRRRRRDQGDARDRARQGGQRLADCARHGTLRHQVHLSGGLDLLRRRRQPAGRCRLSACRDRRRRQTVEWREQVHACTSPRPRSRRSTPSGR